MTDDKTTKMNALATLLDIDIEGLTEEEAEKKIEEYFEEHIPAGLRATMNKKECVREEYNGIQVISVPFEMGIAKVPLTHVGFLFSFLADLSNECVNMYKDESTKKRYDSVAEMFGTYVKQMLNALDKYFDDDDAKEEARMADPLENGSVKRTPTHNPMFG